MRNNKSFDSNHVSTRYRLVNDEDGHSYVIPADKLDSWFSYLSSSDVLGDQFPAWAEEIGGSVACLLTFANPRFDL